MNAAELIAYENLSWTLAIINLTKDYLIHLQQFSILLITAASYVLYRGIQSRNRWAIGFSSFSGVLSIIAICIGLLGYSKILEISLDYLARKEDVNLLVNSWLNWHFWLDLIALGLAAFGLIFLAQCQKKGNGVN